MDSAVASTLTAHFLVTLMYIPPTSAETRIEVLHDLIESYPFAAIVVATADGMIVNHIPFQLDPTRGELGTLRAHVARANPLWQQLSNAEAAVIFQGPQAYISPTWYPSKHEHGKAVPTWNYAVVHAFGKAHAIEDRAWLLQMVTELSNRHEASQALPWKVSDAPQDYIDRLLGNIVGIEIPIAKLEGKWKLHRAKSRADQLGTIAGLQARNTSDSLAVAELMMKSLKDADTPHLDRKAD